MRSLSILIVVALVACVAAQPSVTTVTVGSSTARADVRLAPPNRVVTLPLSPGAPSVMEFRGSNLLSRDRVTIMPAPCDDCQCSNFAFDAFKQDAYVSAAINTWSIFFDAVGDTNTLRRITVPSFWQNSQGAFSDFTKWNTRGLICFFNNANPQDTLVSANVWVSTRFNCDADANTCETAFFSAIADRNSDIRRYASPTEVSLFSTQSSECIIGSSCSCFTPDSTIACCSGKLYDTTSYKCCANGIIVGLGAGCPCASASDCTGTQETSCCIATKYPELNVTQPDGTCYNPTVHRCCDTGARYDPGQDQCCVVNGVQSLNVPCPCGDDSHCEGGQLEGRNENLVCCSQVNPVPAEVVSCSIYSNFPSGTGSFAAQRCLGQCIDPTYQICCNGVTCAANFEKCCNQTCCNSFTGACHRVQLSSAPGQRFNYLNFATDVSIESANLIVDVCTNIRQMTPIRAFWIFILPTAFLLATFLALAVALVYANKAAIRVFTWVERFIIFFAVILSLLACPLYFSPLYKYGGVIALIAFWAIITAATRVRWINAVAIAALIFLQIYLYDPFHGSAYFNLAYWRVWVDSPFAGNTDYRSNGILHTTRMMFPNVTTTNEAQWCTRYYDYFLEDPALKDYDRLDNPLRTTFGYCSRGWVMALYLLSGFIFIASLLLLVLVIMALINRFRKEILEPVELEVRAVPDIAY